MSAKEIILDYVNDQDEKLCYIAQEIWDHPQVAPAGDIRLGLVSQGVGSGRFHD